MVTYIRQVHDRSVGRWPVSERGPGGPVDDTDRPGRTPDACLLARTHAPMSVAAVTFTDSDSSSRPPTCRHPPTSRRRAGPRPSGLAGRPAYWRSYVTSKQLPCAPRARACGICIFPPGRLHGGSSSSSNRTRSRGQGSRQSATRHGRVDAAVTRHLPPPSPTEIAIADMPHD